MRPSRLQLIVAAVTPVAVAATVGLATIAAHAAAAGCRVSYTVSSQWTGGFGASVNVTNLGDPVAGWTLAWTFGAGQQVSQAWNATVTQTGSQVTARNVSWNSNLATNASAEFGFNASWNGSNPVPASFTLNGTACTGGLTSSGPSTSSPTPSAPASTPPTSGGTSPPNSMGFIGCSMAENVAQGYVAVGGKRMWGPYGTSGMVVQSWTDPNSSSWKLFDQQASKYGKPTAVWVQICIFTQGATYDEVKRLIANTRQHAGSGVSIYITGQPLYPEGNTCFLAGANGPQSTDSLAKQAAADATQNVRYAGAFQLKNSEVADGCHANTAGQQSLGRQAIAFWG